MMDLLLEKQKDTKASINMSSEKKLNWKRRAVQDRCRKTGQLHGIGTSRSKINQDPPVCESLVESRGQLLIVTRASQFQRHSQHASRSVCAKNLLRRQRLEWRS